MSKQTPAPNNTFKAKYNALNSNTKALLKFLGVVVVLIGLGLIYHANTDQSMESAQRFFEQRRSVMDPETYQENAKEDESAKKRAERNIFLQN